MKDSPKRSDFRNHPDVVRFVQSARKFCALVESRDWDKEKWAEAILPTLAQLYSEVLRLPAVDPDDFPELPVAFDVSSKQWNELYEALGKFLGDSRWYWAYFDPTEPSDSNERPIAGDLADDLADIYRDVKPGINAWDSNVDEYLEEIIWDWTNVNFNSHWGLHAVDAMRALHRLVFLRGVGDQASQK
jgi:hypothetical protein